MWILNNQWFKEEITWEVRNYLETNTCKNKIQQHLWNAMKVVLRGKFIAVNAYIKKEKRDTQSGVCIGTQGKEQ